MVCLSISSSLPTSFVFLVRTLFLADHRLGDIFLVVSRLVREDLHSE
jgi:hypothetical protein